MPSEIELEKLYAEHFYTDLQPQYFKNYEEDYSWWWDAYSERFDFYEKQITKGPKLSVLDVGSGPGIFLEVGLDRGWEVLGIEPSKAAWQYTTKKNLPVLNRYFNEQLTLDKKYDVIHLSEVLEHVPEPLGILSHAKKFLKPDGILNIIVPNDFSPFQKILKEQCKFKEWWIKPPEHLNYFSRKSLCALVEDSGYEILLSTATFPIDLFLLLGDDYIADGALGRTCHKKRMRMEKLLDERFKELRLDWYESMAKLDIGREIILYARPN